MQFCTKLFSKNKNGMTSNKWLNTTPNRAPSRKKNSKSENSAINKKGAENTQTSNIPTMTGPVSGSFELM